MFKKVLLTDTFTVLETLMAMEISLTLDTSLLQTLHPNLTLLRFLQLLQPRSLLYYLLQLILVVQLLHRMSFGLMEVLLTQHSLR